jgi:hypothetical protein
MNLPLVRTARLFVLGGTIAAALSLIALAIFRMRVPATCTYDPLHGFTSFALVSVSIAGFIGGHLLGRWTEASNVARVADRVPARGAGIRRGLDSLAGSGRAALVVQGLLVLLLALGVALLAYETLALADTQKNWPITFYVRCFANTYPAWAGIGALALCSLFGQWIWYPGRGE